MMSFSHYSITFSICSEIYWRFHSFKLGFLPRLSRVKHLLYRDNAEPVEYERICTEKMSSQAVIPQTERICSGICTIMVKILSRYVVSNSYFSENSTYFVKYVLAVIISYSYQIRR